MTDVLNAVVLPVVLGLNVGVMLVGLAWIIGLGRVVAGIALVVAGLIGAGTALQANADYQEQKCVDAGGVMVYDECVK